METTTRSRESDSLLGLISGLREDVRDLFQEEVKLAKTEISEKVALLRRNAISLAIGGVIAHLALVFLMLGVGFLVAYGFEGLGLTTGTALFLGFVAVAVVSGIVGAILVAKAIRAFSKESLMPEKTIETLKEIKEGGLEQGPVKVYRATLPPQDDNRNSEQIRSDLEQTRDRIGREVRGIRSRLKVARITTGVVNQVANNPVRSVGIGLGTGLAGYVLMRVTRLFGRRRHNARRLAC